MITQLEVVINHHMSAQSASQMKFCDVCLTQSKRKYEW